MFKKFNGAIDKSINFKLNQKILYAFFGLYVVVVSVTSYFHEPWYDELQAWQIAKCASIYDIIFTIPHYEGHPPLWHLLLAIFAKCGMNVDFSLHFVNILAMAGAVWILMFKTKIPDILKALLPFTYFMCYQYGVVSRPYSLMALAFVLCAVCYKSKDEKPFRMMLSLLFLCLTSAYGLIYAFFICIAWLIEMYKNQHISFAGFVRYFVKTRTFVSLCVLLVCAVCILLLVIPCDDAYMSDYKGGMRFSVFMNHFVYMMLLLPYEATIGCITQNDVNIFSDTNYIAPEYVFYYLISILIYFILWRAMKSRGKSELILPMLLMPFIFARIFFYAHHIGLVTLYIILLIIIYFDYPNVADEFTIKGISMSIGKIFISFLYIFAAVQILWSVSSCALDMTKIYQPGKKIAEYIKDNGIEDCYILPVGDYMEDVYSFNLSVYALTSVPYLDSNIYPTFWSGEDDEAYFHNSKSKETEIYINEGYDEIMALGKPDYIIGRIPEKYEDEKNSEITENNGLGSSTDFDKETEKGDESGFGTNYDEKVQTEVSKLLNDYYDMDDYTIVYDIPYGCIFKGHYIETYLSIYERKDLLK